jgi:2-methylcitrate dehydratase PrpD
LSAAQESTATEETVTAKMARWAASLDYKHLSPEAVCQAKRFLLDSVGCALKIALRFWMSLPDADPPR